MKTLLLRFCMIFLSVLASWVSGQSEADYLAWAEGHYSADEIAEGRAAPSARSPNGSAVNWAHFVVNTSPQAGPPPGLTVFKREHPEGGLQIALQIYVREGLLPGMHWWIEWSEDLGIWNRDAARFTTTPLSIDGAYIKYEILDALPLTQRRFYKLVAPYPAWAAGEASFGPIEVAEVIDFNSPQQNLRFTYTGVDENIVAVWVRHETALGVENNSFPPFYLGIEGTDGEVNFTFEPQQLPVGPVSLRLTFERADGTFSEPRETSFIVGGDGTGTAPTLSVSTFSLVQLPAALPDVVRPWVTISGNDPDEDVVRVRYRILRPGTTGDELFREVPAASLLRPSSNPGWFSGTWYPFEFNHDSPTGLYRLEMEVVDAAGNVSPRAFREISVEPHNPGPGNFRITSMQPATGEPGTVVNFTTQNRIRYLEFNGVEVPLNNMARVGSTDVWTFTTVVPEGALSSAFVGYDRADPATATRILFSPPFIVPEWIVLSPIGEPPPPPEGEEEELETAMDLAVVAGAALPLQADVRAEPHRQALRLFVEGIEGGDANVGTINPDLVYTAPARPPADGRVTVRAELEADASVFTEIEVEILPAISSQGMGTIFGEDGGTIWTEGFAASLVVPPGAFEGARELAIEPVATAGIPLPQGEEVLSAIRLTPAGLVFDEPLLVSVPVPRLLPDGTVLTARLLDEAGGYVAGSERPAELDGTGLRAVFPVDHFSTYVVSAEALAAPPGPPPQIFGRDPVWFEEGRRVTMRVTGEHLDSVSRIEVFDPDGQPAAYVLVSEYIALPGVAGLLVHMLPDPTLGAGETRLYTLRLHNNGGFAETFINAEGLDELIHTDTTTPLVADLWEPRRVSTFVVGEGAELHVGSGVLDVFSTGPIRIEGSITAHGAPGNPATGFFGAPPTRDGGAGGAGMLDNETRSVNIGQNGAYNFLSAASRDQRGGGGLPGEERSMAPIQAIVAAVDCVFNRIVVGCITAITQIIEIAETERTLQSLRMHGQQGQGGYRGSYPLTNPAAGGGGGGGGGGFLKVDMSAMGLGGFDIQVRGGGGGSGGSGGRDVRLRSLDALRVSGSILTHGGRGGDGSREARLTLHPRVLGVVLGPVHEQVSPAMSGGGGGGGAGGLLELATTGAMDWLPGNHYSVAGGRPGDGGFAFVVPPISSGYRNRETVRVAMGDTRGLRQFFPSFGTDEFRPRITPRFTLPIRYVQPGMAAGAVTDSWAEVEFEDGTTERTVFRYSSRRGGYEPEVLFLRPGRNRIRTSPSAVDPDLYIEVLAIGVDSDGDGLSDWEEINIWGTDPFSADTTGSGLSDSQEVRLGLDPTEWDTDGDSIPDHIELLLGLDPRNRDSDGDGWGDGFELAMGTDPLNPNSVPRTRPPGILMATAVSATGDRELLTLGPDNGFFGRSAELNGRTGVAMDRIGWALLSQTAALRYLSLFPAEGASHFLPPVGVPTGSNTLAFCRRRGELFAVGRTSSEGENTGQLYQIDPATGEATLLGGPHAVPIRALAFRSDEVLFAVLAGAAGAHDRLVTLDRSSGAVLSDIMDLGPHPTRALAFLPGDVLHGAKQIGPFESRLITIDPAAGTITDGPELRRLILDLAGTYRQPPRVTSSSWHQTGGFWANVSSNGFVPVDLNGDGRLEMLATGRITYLGGGGGTLPQRDFYRWTLTGDPPNRFINFGFGRTLEPPFTPTESILVGDLNGNGFTDVIVFEATNPRQGAIYLNEGGSGATFENEPAGFVTRPGTARFDDSAFLAQMNPDTDSHLDLVFINDNGIGILYGAGDGTFASTPVWILTTRPDFLVQGDFDGDGRTDLAWPGTIAYSDGDGTFTLQSFPALGGGAGQTNRLLLAGDFNGNGITDLHTVVREPTGVNMIGFHLGHTGRTLDSRVRASISTSAGPASFALPATALDLTGNGCDDIFYQFVSSPDGTGVYLGHPSGFIRGLPSDYISSWEGGGLFPWSILKAGDFNGNGILDIYGETDSFPSIREVEVID